MSAATFTLEIDRGLPLCVPLQFCQDDAGKVPVDLTGCSMMAAIRPRADEDPGFLLDVAVTDAAQGMVELSMVAEETVALTGEHYAWNLLVTDSMGVKSCLVRGPVQVTGVINLV